MNDSADMDLSAGDDGYEVAIAGAAQRLRAALEAIESRSGRLAQGQGRMTRELDEARRLSEDRAELAQKLDGALSDAKAARAQLDAREREFNALADRTEAQIDAVVTKVTEALGGAG